VPQPRKEQIKDVLTRHARFVFSPDAGVNITGISYANIAPYIISDTYDGAQESTPASAEAWINIPLVNGDTISVQIDGGIVTPIVFDGTETTAARVVDRINTTFGSTIAFILGGNANLGPADYYDGFRITSPTTPTITATSSITLANVTAGVLFKFGLNTTYTGFIAPTRGVVTHSADLRGGYVRLKTLDGKNILTDNPALIQCLNRKIDVPGGIPIHGRLVNDAFSSEVIIEYYARMPLEPEVITFNSSFDLLVAGDTIDFTFTLGAQTVGPVTVIFPGGPGLTRDDVVDAINTAFGTLLGGLQTATVTGSICQPYSFGGLPTLDRFAIIVDEGAIQSFVLTAADVTAAQVAATITGTPIVGLNVVPISDGNGNTYLSFNSTNTTGRTSSLNFCGRTPAFNSSSLYSPSNWSRLGITPGLYRGTIVAEQFGDAEIRIRGLGRGSSCSVVVSSVNAITLTRMGLTAATTVGIDNGEQKINFPDLRVTPTTTIPITTQVQIQALIPEALEFGEVDPAAESIVEQFNNDTAGANQEGALSAGLIFSDPTLSDIRYYGMTNGMSRGVADIGKSVLINQYGQIDAQLLRPAYEEARRTFAKFIRGNFKSGYNTVAALVASIIETPGTNGNPVAKSASFTVDVDPDNSYAATVAFNVRIHRDVGGGVIPFRVERSAAGYNHQATLAASTLLYGDPDLVFADDNTVAAGISTGGPEYLTLSDVNSKYVRILEKYANMQSPSLLRKVNAAWTVTVGDGINSFGDFNGTNAIQQAIAFYSAAPASVLNTMRIQCKEGTYIVSAANTSITVPATIGRLTIEGSGGVTIRNSTDATPIITNTVGADLYLNNITLYGKSGAYSAVEVTSPGSGTIPFVCMTDCDVTYVTMQLTNAEFMANRCSFLTNWFENISVILRDGDTIKQITCIDCDLTVMVNSKPILRVYADAFDIPITTISRVLFERCNIGLRSTINSGGMLAGNCGVIDLVPIGSCYNTGTGINIEEMKWKDCTVVANRGSSTVSVLIHLLPVNNGNIVSDTTTEFARVGNVIIDGGSWLCPSVNTLFNPFTILGVENITIKNVELGFSNGSPHYGIATGEVGYWATGVDTTIPGTEWGAFALYASTKLILEHVKFKNLVRLTAGASAIGDVFIRYNRIYVNDVSMEDIVLAGSGVYPPQRVRLRPATGTVTTRGGTIRDWRIRVNPCDPGTLHSDSVISYEPSANAVDFSNIFISGFECSDLSNGSYAFLIPQAGTNQFYTGSPVVTDNLVIQNSTFAANKEGFELTSAEANQQIGVTFRNNHIYNNILQGISIHMNTAAVQVLKIVLEDNNVHNNAVGFGIPGVYIGSGQWGSGSWIQITNNYCGDNSTAGAFQMRIQTIDFNIDSAPQGMIMGNVFGNTAWNVLWVNIISGAAPAGLVSPTFAPPLMGCHTGQSAASPAAFTFGHIVRMSANLGVLWSI